MTELPRPRPYYVNIYRGLAGACGSVYETRSMADQMAGNGRIACKLIHVVAGDGLEDPKEISNTESANDGATDHRP